VGDADLMPSTSHGVEIPGNVRIDGDERGRRLARFYEPYHAAIDAVLSGCPQALLLSVHSFTPELNGAVRTFDVGVLFDGFEALAHSLADSIADAGLAVRMNEPYSALDGLIFSARSHGRGYGVPYLEIEINNRLLRTDAAARTIALQLATAINRLLDVSQSGPQQDSSQPSRRRFAPPQGERRIEKSVRPEEPRRGLSKH
jgi:predicted N-formylglutamate amidohydrolase